MRKTFFVAVIMMALASMAFAGDGQAVYSQYCASCHMANGQGTPGVFPPLANWLGYFVKSDDGREVLVHIAAFGMQGQISVQGKTYNGFMPPYAQLSNEQIADLFNYILGEWNKDILPKDFKPFTADEVAKYRAKALTPADVLKERNAVAAELGIK